MSAHTLFPGMASGPLMVIEEPLSAWGGIDPATGRITAPRLPACGQSVAGTVLALKNLIGSSSSAAVMLELIHSGHAPAALILAKPDAIIVVGCLAAREMHWTAPPIVALPPDTWPQGSAITATVDAPPPLRAKATVTWHSSAPH